MYPPGKRSPNNPGIETGFGQGERGSKKREAEIKGAGVHYSSLMQNRY